MKIKYILTIALMIMFFAGCNQTDDVSGIFVGKTWKLTDIMKDQSKPVPIDYWSGNGEKYETSMELKQVSGNYTLVFDGIEDNGIILGNFSGNVTNATVSGTWSANGKKNNFSFSRQNAEDNDILGQAYIRAMNGAYKYEGDYDNFRIYFEDGTIKGYLLFHVQK